MLKILQTFYTALILSLLIILIGCFVKLVQLGTWSSKDVQVTLFGATQNQKLSNLFPNKVLTPGVMSANPIADICKNGTGKYRNVSEITKKAVYKEYGIPYPQPKGTYETDHFYPLGITGDNDIKNLWPMPAPQFHWKDVVESYLNRQVCDRKMTIPQAKSIIDNWYDYYQNNLKTKLGNSGNLYCEEGCE